MFAKYYNPLTVYKCRLLFWWRTIYGPWNAEMGLWSSLSQITCVKTVEIFNLEWLLYYLLKKFVLRFTGSRYSCSELRNFECPPKCILNQMLLVMDTNYELPRAPFSVNDSESWIFLSAFRGENCRQQIHFCGFHDIFHQHVSNSHLAKKSKFGAAQ